MDLKDIGRRVKECNHEAQDSDRFLASVRAVMNHQIVQTTGHFFSKELLSTQDESAWWGRSHRAQN